jgi:hypothetical protein
VTRETDKTPFRGRSAPLGGSEERSPDHALWPAGDLSDGGEDVGFPRELLEEALGHQIGTAVERAYRRTDSFERRRTVMQAWADFCHGRPFRAPTV